MKGSVRKRGEKWSYYFSYKQDGKYKKKEKGGFRTKKEAETALREVLQQYEKQGFVQNNPTNTLQEYIDYWYDTVAVTYLKYNTLTLYKRTIKNHIKNELGFIKINNINPATLQKYFSEKQKTLSNSSVNAIKNILNNTFKLAIKQNIILTNPIKQIEVKPKKVEKRVSTLTQQELETILKATKKTSYYMPIMIAIQTGARRSEILALTWDDIDFENNKITINKTLLAKDKGVLEISSTKNLNSNRTILMTSKLKNELLTWKDHQQKEKEFYGELYSLEGNFVCTNEDGKPINPKTLSTQINILGKKLNISLKFHDLRHTHATMLLESDVNIKVIQERLGHSNISTTLNIYSHVTSQIEKESINKFEQRFNT